MSSGNNGTWNAVLGMLTLKPMSGYEMRKMVGDSIGHFWNESYGQLYPTLKALAAEGLVEKATETQEGKPERHVYSLTDSGRERFRVWLRIPAKAEVQRNELLLKLFFGEETDIAVSRGHVLAFMEESEGERRQFVGLREFLRKEWAGDPRLPYWLITLNRGLREAEAEVVWARETLETLDEVEGVGEVVSLDNERQEAGDGA